MEVTIIAAWIGAVGSIITAVIGTRSVSDPSIGMMSRLNTQRKNKGR